MESRNWRAFLQRFFFGILLNLPPLYLLVSNKDWFTLIIASTATALLVQCEDKCVLEIAKKKKQFLVDLVVFIVTFYIIRRYILFR